MLKLPTCLCSSFQYMRRVIQYPFHSWGHRIYLQLPFCQTMSLEACSRIVVEPWLWKQSKNFLLVMDNWKKVEEHKMRSIPILLPPSISLSLSLPLKRFYINCLPVQHATDATSSECLPKTHFKFYTDESGAGPSLPQNVSIYFFTNYHLLFYFIFIPHLSSICCRCYDEMPLQELQATQEQQTIQNLCDTLRTILRL